MNDRLVRGLDYYNYTVFEWVTDSLGAQGTVCAGGRYDGLVEQLGGKPCPGIGFAMGVERLILLLQETDQLPEPRARADVYVVSVGDEATDTAVAAVQALRREFPGCRIIQHCGGGSFKSQMKKADKSGAQVALLWGEDEVAAGTVAVKTLRGEQAGQQSVPVTELGATLQAALSEAKSNEE